MKKLYPSIENLPEHVRAAWTPEQRRFYEGCYDQPHLGPEWITAHRCLEAQMADKPRRDFLLDHFPREALKTLDGFKHHHFDAEPDTGHFSYSSVADRVRTHYPNLFPFLRARIQPIYESVLDTHPHLASYCNAFRDLDAAYHRKLAAAIELTNHMKPGKARSNKRHEHYREAFAAIYPQLLGVLKGLVAACEY